MESKLVTVEDCHQCSSVQHCDCSPRMQQWFLRWRAGAAAWYFQSVDKSAHYEISEGHAESPSISSSFQIWRHKNISNFITGLVLTLGLRTARRLRTSLVLSLTTKARIAKSSVTKLIQNPCIATWWAPCKCVLEFPNAIVSIET